MAGNIRWTVDEENVIRDNWGILSLNNIADMLPLRTASAVYNKAMAMGLTPIRGMLASRKSVKELDHATLIGWAKLRALSYRALYNKYGINEEEVDKILGSVLGYEVFKFNTRSTGKVVALLKEFNKHLDFIPRKFKLFINENDNCPYLRVQLPSSDLELDKVKIIPLGDVHYAEPSFDEELFDTSIKWIADTDGVYVILLGDMIENSSKYSVADSVYRQSMSPQAQAAQMISKLAPIQHKILAYVRGNHERRSANSVGIDMGEVIASKLEIPYYREPAFIDVIYGEHTFTFYAWHGRSSARSEGGKLNAALSPLMFTEHCCFFLSGHVHDATDKKKNRIVRNPIDFTLDIKKQYIVICSSFLNYFDSYGSELGYAPPAKGLIACWIYPDGDYRVSM